MEKMEPEKRYWVQREREESTIPRIMDSKKNPPPENKKKCTYKVIISWDVKQRREEVI